MPSIASFTSQTSAVKRKRTSLYFIISLLPLIKFGLLRCWYRRICSFTHVYFSKAHLPREKQFYLSCLSVSTAASPPYSQTASGGVYFVPFAAGPGVGIAPVAIENPGYASLYAAPPAYEATPRSGANRTTTTGIGSVTSLREAAKDDG